MSGSGFYLYCSDDRQDLYDRATREAIGADVVFSLSQNCRNTVLINDTSNSVIDEHVPAMDGLPPGVPTLMRCPSSKAETTKEAWRQIADWSGPGIRIAVLSPFRLENSVMATARSGHGMRLVQQLADWESPGAVLFASIKSFKGLEADAVVVVDVAAPLERRDLYVACTRARARLALFFLTEHALAAATQSRG